MGPPCLTVGPGTPTSGSGHCCRRACGSSSQRQFDPQPEPGHLCSPRTPCPSRALPRVQRPRPPSPLSLCQSGHSSGPSLARCAASRCLHVLTWYDHRFASPVILAQLSQLCLVADTPVPGIFPGFHLFGSESHLLPFHHHINDLYTSKRPVQ